MLCSDHPENAFSEKAVLAAQQNLLNSFADFLIYISLSHPQSGIKDWWQIHPGDAPFSLSPMT